MRLFGMSLKYTSPLAATAGPSVNLKPPASLTGLAPGATRSAALPTLGQAAAAKNNRMNEPIVFLREKLIRLV